MTRTNIQFGEGGAGTFSDGKLNTGIKSPHIRHVLEAFVEAGAPEDILVDAKPHIGTDLLVGVVRNLRRAIEEAGGEVRFLTRLDGLVLEGESVPIVRASPMLSKGAGGEDDEARASLPFASSMSARERRKSSPPIASCWPAGTPRVTPSKWFARPGRTWPASPSPWACALSIPRPS